MFNDKNSTIKISTPGKRVITLDDKKGVIIFKDNKNEITIGSEGIILKSNGNINMTASGDVKIEGTNVVLQPMQFQSRRISRC